MKYEMSDLWFRFLDLYSCDLVLVFRLFGRRENGGKWTDNSFLLIELDTIGILNQFNQFNLDVAQLTWS